jgi:hypothetical protein
MKRYKVYPILFCELNISNIHIFSSQEKSNFRKQ